MRPWRHLSGASWKFKGFDVPAGRLRPLTSPASERRAAQGWRPGVTPRHRKEHPDAKAAWSAIGYERKFWGPLIFVRFTPESRHRDGCRFTPACDPKQKLMTLDG